MGDISVCIWVFFLMFLLKQMEIVCTN